MSLVENFKKVTEKATRMRRPTADQLFSLTRQIKPRALRFNGDGVVPNHPSWPVLVFRGAVRLPRSLDPAAVFEDLFKRNNWDDSWRGSVYDYLHYHSRIHEVMGIARGSATVRVGGVKGRDLKIRAGDVVLLPAGTGHQCLSASKTFLAVGAYPPTGTYDECAPTKSEYERNARRVRRVVRPATDPVFGSSGALLEYWTKE
jgi:uncharacterized protein YjlB